MEHAKHKHDHELELFYVCQFRELQVSTSPPCQLQIPLKKLRGSFIFTLASTNFVDWPGSLESIFKMSILSNYANSNLASFLHYYDFIFYDNGLISSKLKFRAETRVYKLMDCSQLLLDSRAAPFIHGN